MSHSVAAKQRREASPGARASWGLRGWLVSSGWVILTVVLANFAYLTKIRSNNPLMYTSGLAKPDFAPGWYTIDANDGWTAQALGKLAAQSWLHGDVPLWNTYEGLGQPLAGEMQSASLFLPFTLLQLLPNGIFVMHFVLEVCAGLFTLALLRYVGTSRLAATVGGCLFAITGAMAVMQNAPFNPIAFLPMGVLGVEMVRVALLEGKQPRLAAWVCAMAMAFMLFAGFPETAFLEAFFIFLWFLTRLLQLPKDVRVSFAKWVVGSALTGVVVAAPILVAFADFMTFATTAYHEGIANNTSYPLQNIGTFATPFIAGFIMNQPFRFQAGYLTLPGVFVGLLGLLGPRPRGLKWLLGGTALVLTLNMFGFTPVKLILNHVPGISAILTYKYGLASIEFVVIILIAFGLDDLRTKTVKRTHIAIAAAIVLAWLVAAIIGLGTAGYFKTVLQPVLFTAFVLLVLAALVGAYLRGTVPSVQAGARGVMTVAALALVGNAVAMYATPQLSASAPVHVDTDGVNYLKKHIGTSRFYTIGPISPNYGSYFQIASLNANDLPVPKKYADYVTHELKPKPGTPGAKGTAKSFNGYQLVPFNPPPSEGRALLEAYAQEREAYRAAGVKYLVMRPKTATPRAKQLGLQKVFSSRMTEIWLDPGAKEYYEADGCTFSNATRSSVTAVCDKATTLTRREMPAPGWSANVAGRSVDLQDPPGQYFQTVDLPAGKSEVSFSYVPRGFVAAAIVSILTLVGGSAWALWPRRARARRDKTSV